MLGKWFGSLDIFFSVFKAGTLFSKTLMKSEGSQCESQSVQQITVGAMMTVRHFQPPKVAEVPGLPQQLLVVATSGNLLVATVFRVGASC